MKLKLASATVMAIAALSLGGCAVYGPPPAYYGQGGPYYGGAQPVYAAPAPVYVGPPVSIGLGFGYWGGRGWGGGHRHY